MAGKTTRPYKATLSGSIGAGIGSVFNPSGRKYYILEHKVGSKYHRAGEAQEIIVDQIEIGRDSRCQVRFDDKFSTVSRRHAAIIKDGDNWKLVQISKTNTTLLNGRPVQNEWYLQNGDEIQLSVNGPKLGFIVPTGKKATVGSIGLTRRLSLFRQQALRPYKQAIAAMATVLILAVGGLTTWNVLLQQDLKSQSSSLADQIIQAKNNKAKADSLSKALVAANKKISETEKELSKTKSIAQAALRRPIPHPNPNPAPVDLGPCYPHTYYVECYFLNSDGNILTLQDGTPIGWSGTGFMLNNGCFVTAQHVVHWDEIGIKRVKDSQGNTSVVVDPDDLYTQLNYYYYAGLLSVKMFCVSSAGEFSITYNYTKMPFTLGNAHEASSKITDEQGKSWIVRNHNYNGSGDYAYIKVNGKSGMEYDASFSMNMPASTQLHILGFPAKQGVKSKGSISPIYSQAVTSRQGLEDNGTIKTSNDNSDHGNSGGPVLASKDGKLKVVGILSGANSGSASMKGRVVPIGAAFK